MDEFNGIRAMDSVDIALSKATPFFAKAFFYVSLTGNFNTPSIVSFVPFGKKM